eukprot:TRINITY_DN10096_c0_g2_i2.p1 TRINITY_DN10096_c0_g2~~TRINITY_DN10096_c0_g2_i2.p1  ORF type:complete len:1421 (+),score=253.06 TRINITY_DN10096_c0_g2_i2:202-4464(+)
MQHFPLPPFSPTELPMFLFVLTPIPGCIANGASTVASANVICSGGSKWIFVASSAPLASAAVTIASSAPSAIVSSPSGTAVALPMSSSPLVFGIVQTNVFPPPNLPLFTVPGNCVAVTDDGQMAAVLVLQTSVTVYTSTGLSWTFSTSSATTLIALSSRYLIVPLTGGQYPCNMVYTLSAGHWTNVTLCYPLLNQLDFGYSITGEQGICYYGGISTVCSILDDSFFITPYAWFMVNQGGPGQWGIVNTIVRWANGILYHGDFFPSFYGFAVSQQLISVGMPARYVAMSAVSNPQLVFIGAIGCSPGFFYNSTEQQCLPCLSGTYNPYVAMSTCQPCPDGQTGPSGSIAASSCFACAPGFYCQNGTITPCPEGTYNSAGSGKSVTDCVQCPIGTASSALAATSCPVCPAGTAALPGSAQCSQCQPGSYATAAGQETCTQCLAGRYSTTLGAESGSVCLACPAGTYNPDSGSSSITACTNCTAGTFSTQSGAPFQSVCLPCGAGFYGPLQGQTSTAACLPCAPGSYSQYQGAVQCTLCPTGTFAAAGGDVATVCLSCPAGSYASSTGQSVCTTCPAGTFSNATAATSSAVCQPCQAGTYSAVTGATSSSVCVLCQDGTFSANSGVSVCTSCPVGTFGVATGAKVNSTCSPCAAGTYGSASGSSACTNCPFNMYSSAIGATSAVTCTACLPGLGTMASGSKSSSACLQCPVGFWYSPTTGCNACKAGTWSSTVNATSSTQCIQCAAGTFSTAGNATSPNICVPCSPGSKSASGATSCGACLAGTTSGSADNQCEDCQPGTYGSSAGVCSQCPAGTVSAAGATACGACAAGTYQQAASCALCPAGSYQTNTSSTACLLCPPGTYGVGTGQQSAALACVACGFGLYSDVSGASSASACKSCLPGTYQNVTGASSSEACLPCPANTFSNVSAAVAVTACQPCPAAARCYVGAQASEIVVAPSIMATGGSLQAGVLYGSDVASRQDYASVITNHVNEGQRNLDVVMLLVAVAVIALVTAIGVASCRAAVLETLLSTADWVFWKAHRTSDGEPVVARKTPLGGLMSFMLALLVALVLIYLTAQFSMFNQSVLSTVVAGQIPQSPTTSVTISVQAAAYSGECNPNSTSLQPTYSGILFTTPPSYSVSYNALNRSCIVTWTCDGCTVSTPASLLFPFAETNAAAAMLQWQVLATQLIASESNSVRGFVQSTSTAAVFRGSQTIVQISVFNTLFTPPASAPPVAGVRLFNGSIVPGALQTAQTYSQQTGVAVLFDLQLFVGYAQITVLAPISWVNLFTSIFSLCGAVFTVTGLALALLEFVLSRVRSSRALRVLGNVPLQRNEKSLDYITTSPHPQHHQDSRDMVQRNPLYRVPSSPQDMALSVGSVGHGGHGGSSGVGSETAPAMVTGRGVGAVMVRPPLQQPRGGYDDL